MNIVIDTNIVFSAILSKQGKIHDLLLNSTEQFTFYAPTFLLDELELHHEKLKRISGLDDSDIKFLKRILLHHVEFIDPEVIGVENWQKAFEITKEVDEKDTPFVALTLEIGGFLWTGDKKLISGLSKKGLNFMYTTEELFSKRD